MIVAFQGDTRLKKFVLLLSSAVIVTLVLGAAFAIPHLLFPGIVKAGICAVAV